MTSRESLEKRFFEFAASLPGSERIDYLPLSDAQIRAKKADFFWEQRKIVCESKSLQADGQYKIHQTLESYRSTPWWPVFYGVWDLQKVLKHLPDREELNRKIVHTLTSVVENQIRDANRQIRQTKQIFSLPAAGGLVVILNDIVDVLSPELIAYRITKAFRKKTKEGRPRFPEVSCAWIISETHYVQLGSSAVVPSLIISNSVGAPDFAQVRNFMDSVFPKWVAFNGETYIEFPGEFSLRDFATQSLKKARANTKCESRRYELWQLMYSHRPYLRKLSEAEFVEYGQRLIMAFAAAFLKGGPPVSQGERLLLSERWTHLLEEISFRGFDMRDFKANELALRKLRIERAHFNQWFSYVESVAAVGASP